MLEAGGSSLAKAVKVNVFLANMDDFAAVNEVYAKHFPDPKPVSILTCVCHARRMITVSNGALGSHVCCRQDLATRH